MPSVSPKPAGEINKSGERPVMNLIRAVSPNIGGTPLMYAASSRNIEVVRLLLEKGADVNARHSGNGGALMLAAQMGNPGIVKLLVEKGADVNLRNDYGYTALMYAATAESNDPELIKPLLAGGAEVNLNADDGETALTLAGRKGKTEIVRLLKQAGAKE
jgi:ankyrin repeat protein